MREIDISIYLKDILDEIRLDYENTVINYESEEAGPIYVSADRQKLRRVISNIISNAVRYNDKENVVVNVTLRSDTKTKVIIEIQDNGPGVDKDILPHIFDRFFRADLARTSCEGGSGLGLAIARQIIDGHGGEIWAKSKPWEGMRIFISLRINGEQKK